MKYTKETTGQITDELKTLVDATYSSLNLVSDEDASRRPAPGKWSKKEIIGHLIDSATNNHQRFIRAPQNDVLVFPGYAQDDWVNAQYYNDRAWSGLLDFWKSYNHHIAHVIARIPEEEYDKECRVGSYEPSSLGYLVDDYLVHMKHHLKALL